MKKFKTAEKNRTNYVYYTAEGKAITIKPGQVGDDSKPASEEMITLLHTWDDDQVDADRRELYHCPVHYQAYADGEGKDTDDRNGYLASEEADPLEQMLSSIEEQEHSDYKKFWLNQTNVQIAAEEGITEAAVRNRLKKSTHLWQRKSDFPKLRGFDSPSIFAYGQREQQNTPSERSKCNGN